MKKMNRFGVVAAFVFLLMGFAGCGNEKAEKPETSDMRGSIEFEIDMPTAPSTKGASKAVGLTLNAVTISLIHRDTEASKTLNLTIEDNKASGRLDNLVVGEWEVSVHVFTEEGYEYGGDEIVTVKAGMTVGANLLLELAEDVNAIGSVIFNIGFNPFPGYKKMRSISSETILVSEKGVVAFNSSGQMLLYDSMLENPIFYDMPFPYAPEVTCLNETGDVAYAAFMINHNSLEFREYEIFSIDLLTGEAQFMMNSYNLQSMTKIGTDLFMFVHTPLELEVVDSVSDFRVYYSRDDDSPDFVYSPSTKSFYYLTSHPDGDGSIITNISYYSVLDGFELSQLQSVDYTGQYALNGPLVLVPSKNRLVTGSGDMFNVSSDYDLDMTYIGSIGMSFVDFGYFAGDDHIFLVSDYSTENELVVLDELNYLPVASLPLAGNHKALRVTENFVYVFTEYEGVTLAKVWDKSFLVDHL